MSNSASTQPVIKQLIRRRLALPALLFLTALQPLHFVAGHLLLLAAPLSDMLGLEGIGAWGMQLNDPTTIAIWRQRLTQAADEAEEQTRA